MDDPQRTRASRYLSYVLRHRPDSIDLGLDANGWVAIDELLAALARNGRWLTRLQLLDVVARDAKQRFAFDTTGTRIRAQQGHSIELELGYAPAPPPSILYHGTVASALTSIRAHGILRMGRHHVHLSADEATARIVGGRRGPPVILRVDARAMHEAGHEFFVTPNGVWLTHVVPPEFSSG